MSSNARKLAELEAAGTNFSRNRNFELFRDPRHRGALDLRRRLIAWAELIRSQHAAGDLELQLTEEEGGCYTYLRLSFRSLHGHCDLRLSREELELLRRQEGLADLLADRAAGDR